MMPKLTKRIVEALERDPDRDVFMWDTEVRGFGMRVKPSGTKTFIIQYRNVERRTRRFVIGQYGVLTVEVARDLAKKKLASVIDGSDPSQERRAAREGMTVAEVCDWYLEEAEAGRLLGRNRRPIKASSVSGDRSRIEQHIKPLIGTRVVAHLKLADIESLQADIAAGRSARERRAGRGGQTSGGAGVAGRAISTLRSLLNHARRLGIIEQSPANVCGSSLQQLTATERRRGVPTSEDHDRWTEGSLRQSAAPVLLLTLRRMAVWRGGRSDCAADNACLPSPIRAQMRAAGDAALSS